MRKLIYLLFLLPFMAVAQNATVTPSGTATSVTEFKGGVWPDRLLKTPVIDTTALFPNVPNLGRVITFGNKLYHHNGSGYKRIAYFSDIPGGGDPNLQSVLNVGGEATIAGQFNVTAGGGTDVSQINVNPNGFYLGHDSKSIIFTDEYHGTNSTFEVEDPVNPKDAVNLEFFSNTAEARYIPVGGTNADNPVTGNIEIDQFSEAKIISNSPDGTNSIELASNDLGLILKNTKPTYGDTSLTLNGGVQVSIPLGYEFTRTEGYIVPVSDAAYVPKKYVDDAVVGAGGSQTLNQTLTNGNTTAQSITFTDTGSPAGINGSTAGYVKFTGGNLLIGANAAANNVTTFKDHGIEIGSNITDGIKGLAYFGSGYTANSFVQKTYVDNAVAGAGATNLTYTASPTNGIVNSDTGTDATLPTATGTNAGLLPPAGFTILMNTSGTNTGDNAANSTSLAKASNLSDLPSASTARTNLGLTALATTTPATGVATFLTTPSSANLAAAVTDETGTGVAVFSASPVLTGTPTAPTATPGTNSTQLATTAYADAIGAGKVSTTGNETIAGTKTFSSNIIGSIMPASNNTGNVGATGTAFATGAISTLNASNIRAIGTTLNFQSSGVVTNASVTGGVWNFVNPITIAPAVSGTDGVNLNQLQAAVIPAYRSVATSTTLLATDYTVTLSSGTATFTLPTAVGITGKIYIVKNKGAGVLTVATTSSQTMDGVTTATVSTQNAGRVLQSNGTSWDVIGLF